MVEKYEDEKVLAVVVANEAKHSISVAKGLLALCAYCLACGIVVVVRCAVFRRDNIVTM